MAAFHTKKHCCQTFQDLSKSTSNNIHCSPLLRFFQRSKFLAVPLFLSEHTYFSRKTLTGVDHDLIIQLGLFQSNRQTFCQDGWLVTFQLKRKKKLFIFGRTPQPIPWTSTSPVHICEQSFTSSVHFVNWRPFGLRVGPPVTAIPAMLSPSAPQLGTGTHDHRPIPKS